MSLAARVGLLGPVPSAMRGTRKPFTSFSSHTTSKVLARNAVLDRPADVVVSAPSSEVLTLEDGLWQQDGFKDYQGATQDLENLAALTDQIENALSDFSRELENQSLDMGMLENLLPMDTEAEKTARRAKRAATRAARKAQTANPKQPAASPNQAVDNSLAMLEDTKTKLEALLARESYSEVSTSRSVSTAATSSSQSALTWPPRHEQQRDPGQVSIMQAGPSLPALQQAESSWAKEKHQRRASRYSRQQDSSTAAKRSGAALADAAATKGDAVAMFMKQASNSDLLHGDEAKELTLQVQDLLWLQSVRSQIKNILKRDPTAEELAKAVNTDAPTLMVRLNAGQAAKSQMLRANYRLVIAVCKKYQNRGVTMQDLITEGVQGLLKGVEKFDPTKGFRFSTYAHWWIRQAITRSIAIQGRALRLPAHVIELLSKLQTAKGKLAASLGRDPTLQELSEATGVTSDKIIETFGLAQQPSSLEQPLNDGEGATMMDMLEDDRSQPDDELDDSMLKEDLEGILATLSEREAGVVRYRYGLSGFPVMTLEDIGEKFNVTRERIRQIEAKALRKLKARQQVLESKLSEYKLGKIVSTTKAARNSRGIKKT